MGQNLEAQHYAVQIHSGKQRHQPAVLSYWVPLEEKNDHQLHPCANTGE